jgi:hypothetical protein
MSICLELKEVEDYLPVLTFFVVVLGVKTPLLLKDCLEFCFKSSCVLVTGGNFNSLPGVSSSLYWKFLTVFLGLLIWTLLILATSKSACLLEERFTVFFFAIAAYSIGEFFISIII